MSGCDNVCASDICAHESGCSDACALTRRDKILEIVSLSRGDEISPEISAGSAQQRVHSLSLSLSLSSSLSLSLPPLSPLVKVQGKTAG